MYVIHRKRICMILICLLLGIFAYSYEGTKMQLSEESEPTTSTPVSGKVIVIDARPSGFQTKELKAVVVQQKHKLI